jgi:hypothetical protein
VTELCGLSNQSKYQTRETVCKVVAKKVTIQMIQHGHNFDPKVYSQKTEFLWEANK